MKKKKYLTADDLFGILPGTETETREEIRRIKKLRKKRSGEIERRIKRVTKQLYSKDTKAKATKAEERKYVLSTASDYAILKKVKQLEKKRLSKPDRETVALIRTQLELEWRKHLLKKLNELLARY